jgi:glycosyltransferase involved in cell wall biosynthesis
MDCSWKYETPIGMKILLIHNKYKQEPGGESFVFQSEGELLSRHGHFVERLVFDNANLKTILDKCLSGLRILYNPTSAKELKKKIEHFNPDIIHVHNFVPLASPSIFYVAKKYNVPVILTLHNYRLICPSVTLYHKQKIYEKSINSIFPVEAILKGVYRNSRIQTAAVASMVALHNLIGTWRTKIDFYITLSNFAKEKFRESRLSIPEEHFVVKPNFVQDCGMGDAIRKDYFLYVGRFVEEKGIQTLLNAAQLYNFKLTLIGDGPLRKMVENAARTNPNIRCLGFLDKISIINHMKKCKALILPSLWYEGLPLALLEAFSTGTVVIASKLGTMAEIIQNKVNGLLFDPGNERDLAHKISEIDTQQEWAKCLADNARLSYLMHYTPEKNYSLLTNIYTRALALKRQEQDKLLHHTMPQFHSRKINFSNQHNTVNQG